LGRKRLDSLNLFEVGAMNPLELNFSRERASGLQESLQKFGQGISPKIRADCPKKPPGWAFPRWTNSKKHRRTIRREYPDFLPAPPPLPNPKAHLPIISQPLSMVRNLGLWYD